MNKQVLRILEIRTTGIHLCDKSISIFGIRCDFFFPPLPILDMKAKTPKGCGVGVRVGVVLNLFLTLSHRAHIIENPFMPSLHNNIKPPHADLSESDIAELMFGTSCRSEWMVGK